MASPSTSSIHPYQTFAKLEPISLIGLAGGLELVGGALLILGLFTPAGRLHPVGRDGLRLLDGACAARFSSFGEWRRRGRSCFLLFLYIAAAGPGPWSIDAVSGRGALHLQSPLRRTPGAGAARRAGARARPGKLESRQAGHDLQPFAAGGGTDIHIRLLGETPGRCSASRSWSTRSRAPTGTLAPALLLNAKLDGHQLACMSINSLRYPHYQPTTWHPLRDFAYIIGLSGYTIGIVVRADTPWKTFDELIAAAKKAPEKYNYATRASAAPASSP